MTDPQWQDILNLISGAPPPSPAIGFIIDSPWLPGWHGDTTLDYYTSDEIWLQANSQAVQTFPEAIFVPGFWSEYGMCTEPSAFGAKQVWYKSELPHAGRVIAAAEQISALQKPCVETDGLLPFVIARLAHAAPRLESMGHRIRFAISRGPLNIASFLMGTTEFMTLLALEQELTHSLLSTITDFIVDWLRYQKTCFPSIDGIFVLDDLVGFVGDRDCRTFVVPYLTKIFAAFPAAARFFHNDAKGLVCAPHLSGCGVNMFNFSHEHPMDAMRRAAGESMVLVGNIPPREVLASGTAQDVKKAVAGAWESCSDRSRILWSCGGGMPPGVPEANIRSFIAAVLDLHNT